MSTVKMLQRSLKQRLTRGAKVVVGESYPEPELRGKEMVLAPKSVVKCNGKGRCAHDNCIGLAAFVTEPGNMVVDKSGKKSEKSKNIGWRSGTTKICLTHLRTPEGDELVPEEDEVTSAPAVPNGATNGAAHEPTNRVRERLEHREESPSRANETDTSWEALAQAANASDKNEIIRIARALKRETERLKQRLMDTQERLLTLVG